MQSLGKVKSIQKDFMTGKIVISVMLDEIVDTEVLQTLSSEDEYSISIEKPKKKRSNDANSMLWACLRDISQKTGRSAWTEYMEALKEHGGKFTYIAIKPEAVETMKTLWRECEIIGNVDIDGEERVEMICYYGSSKYTSKEFSNLLDYVIERMKELGIQPPPSKEMRRVLEKMEKREKQNDTISTG